ncbi:response regulator [Aliarcobacter cryaerophilus]|uniref:response regulator transcription factor n=1 Tax=Aliarcobacter cryaerophilus TaxID=28198 RepID=UPI003DA67C83
MKIIIIEDNEHKRKKIKDFILNISANIHIDEAYSYTTGLKKCLHNEYHLLILDMTMPTYEKSHSESGGTFRTYGGKEIIRQLKRKNKELPFVIVSQYSKFSDNTTTLSLDEISQQLKEISPNFFIETVLYDTSSSNWKIILEEIIKARI